MIETAQGLFGSNIPLGNLIDFSKSEGFWFVFLLMMWAMLLVGGFMVGRPDSTRERRMPVWTRIGSSLILVIASWLFWVSLPEPTNLAIITVGDEFDKHITQYARWLFLGMTLGFIGDLFMANSISLKRIGLGNVDHVLFGMIAFGAGHIAYILGFMEIMEFIEIWAGGIGTLMTVSMIVWWGIAVIAWFLLIYLPARKNASILHYAALPYALLLATTTGIAYGLWLHESEFIFLALGAVLFLISDLILAMRLFNGFSFRLIDDVVWLTYGPGQMLIVMGIAFFGMGIVPDFLGF